MLGYFIQFLNSVKHGLPVFFIGLIVSKPPEYFSIQ